MATFDLSFSPGTLVPTFWSRSEWLTVVVASRPVFTVALRSLLGIHTLKDVFVKAFLRCQLRLGAHASFSIHSTFLVTNAKVEMAGVMSTDPYGDGNDLALSVCPVRLGWSHVLLFCRVFLICMILHRIPTNTMRTFHLARRMVSFCARLHASCATTIHAMRALLVASIGCHQIPRRRIH